MAFALLPPRNPSRGGQVSLSFTLPVASRARLELLDVHGRRVAIQDVGGAGRHDIVLGEGQRVASGVYFVRLTQDARVAKSRVVVVE